MQFATAVTCATLAIVHRCLLNIFLLSLKVLQYCKLNTARIYQTSHVRCFYQ